MDELWQPQVLDFSDSSNLSVFFSVTPLRKSFLLELLCCLENILPVEGRGLVWVEVAVTGQWLACDCGISVRTLDLESDGGRPSSTTCHRGRITRNICKKMREQPAMKESQTTQESEVALHEYKREFLVKDFKYV